MNQDRLFIARAWCLTRKSHDGRRNLNAGSIRECIDRNLVGIRVRIAVIAAFEHEASPRGFASHLGCVVKLKTGHAVSGHLEWKCRNVDELKPIDGAILTACFQTHVVDAQLFIDQVEHRNVQDIADANVDLCVRNRIGRNLNSPRLDG